MAESLVIVTAGTTLGSALAIAATRVLAHWARIDAGLNPDRRVLLFTLVIASLVAIAFSLTPFARAMQISLDQALRSTTQMGNQSRIRTRIGNFVVAIQIAMCFSLLVAAGLTVRTLLNYEHVDLGMRADDLLVFDVAPQGLTRGIQSWSYYNRLVDQIRAVPGVESVSTAQWRPGSGWLRSGGVRLDGTELREACGCFLERCRGRLLPHSWNSGAPGPRVQFSGYAIEQACRPRESGICRTIPERWRFGTYRR